MWKNKTVIITGSTYGIGKELAASIGKLGGNIVINGRDKNYLDLTLKELKGAGITACGSAGDISNYEFCSALTQYALDHYGRIDVVINNAGISAEGKLEEADVMIYKKLMEINFLGAVYMSKLTLPHLKETKGSIHYISSIGGLHGLSNFSAYASSKMALTALSESLRKELHETGVSVGITYVGFTKNDEKKKIYDAKGALVNVPTRNFIKQQSVELTSGLIIRQIEKRKFKCIHSLPGKLQNLIGRVSPSLMEKLSRIMQNKFHLRENVSLL